LHQNNNIMSTINTKLFSAEDLKIKKYGDLVVFLEGLLEVAEDLEDSLDEIKLMEEEDGYLNSEMLSEMKFMDTQLDYIFKNIKIAVSVLDSMEMKSFVKIKDLPLVCLN
jgi:hypothetical protein